MQSPQPITTKEVKTSFVSPLSSAKIVKEFFALPEVKIRNSIWDIAILTNEKIAVIHGDTHLDILSSDNGLVNSFSGDGHGIQLLKGEHLTINVREYQGGQSYTTSLYTYDGHQLILQKELDGKYVFYIASNGKVLGRQETKGSTSTDSSLSADIISDKDLKVWSDVNFGHFYSYLNSANVKSSPYLFVIQIGEYTSGPEQKTIHVVKPDNSLKALAPDLIEDKRANNNLSGLRFSYINDSIGEGVIIAASVNKVQFDPKTHRRVQPHTVFRKNIDDGSEVWRHSIPSSALTIHAISDKKMILVALSNTNFLIIHSETGAIIQSQKAMFNGIETIITAMDSIDDKIAFGTFDGIVASTSIEDFLKNGFSNLLY